MLTVSDVGRHIDGEWIWRRLSLSVQDGDRLAVVGPSGSGKTLLLRALAGLEPLDEGTVAFEGQELAEWSLPDYRAQVLYLPQSPAFAEGTVEDNLQLVFEFEVHSDRTYSRRRVREYLKRLNRADDFLGRDVSVLSGGERQIVALLRALQLGPKVLLLDEPTANVDAERTRQIETLLSGWLENRPGAALLWTSHDAAQIERVTSARVDLSASSEPSSESGTSREEEAPKDSETSRSSSSNLPKEKRPLS